MNYELAKQLKDAGFPQDMKPSDKYWKDGIEEISSINCVAWKGIYKSPTLEELIEACGEDFVGFYKSDSKWKSDGWNPQHRGMFMIHEDGSTPSEAVAKLYLALHNNNNGSE